MQLIEQKWSALCQRRGLNRLEGMRASDVGTGTCGNAAEILAFEGPWPDGRPQPVTTALGPPNVDRVPHPHFGLFTRKHKQTTSGFLTWKDRLKQERDFHRTKEHGLGENKEFRRRQHPNKRESRLYFIHETGKGERGHRTIREKGTVLEIKATAAKITVQSGG